MCVCALCIKLHSLSNLNTYLQYVSSDDALCQCIISLSLPSTRMNWRTNRDKLNSIWATYFMYFNVKIDLHREWNGYGVITVGFTIAYRIFLICDVLVFSDLLKKYANKSGFNKTRFALVVPTKFCRYNIFLLKCWKRRNDLIVRQTDWGVM